MSLKCVIDTSQCELVLLGVCLGMGGSGGGFQKNWPIFSFNSYKGFLWDKWP